MAQQEVDVEHGTEGMSPELLRDGHGEGPSEKQPWDRSSIFMFGLIILTVLALTAVFVSEALPHKH